MTGTIDPVATDSLSGDVSLGDVSLDVDLLDDDHSTEPSAEPATEPSAATTSLCEVSGRLVEQLTAEMLLLRAVLHRLAQDDLGHVEMHQAFGQLFAGNSETLGTARAFHESIRRLEDSDTQVTPSALMGDENVLATLAGIVGAMEAANELVAADLAAVDAFVSILDENLRARDDVQTSDFAALELIRALASNAVDRLDLARPPHDTTSVFSDLRRLIDHFAESASVSAISNTALGPH